MEHLQVFSHDEFGSVRTLLIGNEPYFVGKDVTDILGYSNSRDALSRHVAEEDRDAVMQSLQEAYWLAKKENRKYRKNSKE